MASPENPFRITVYDKAFTRKGTVGAVQALVATPRHNQQPTAAMTIATTHPRFGDLSAKGARCVIEYRPTPADTYQHLIGGIVRLREGAGPASTSYVTLQIIDDWRLFSRILAWAVPASALSSQTSEYDVRSGNAETVLKAVVTANAITRLGLPVTVATNGVRGGNISVSLRFKPLTDELIPAVDQAGIGTTVRQVGAGLVVDCYTPATYPRTLSEASGVVQEWKWTDADPEATRVVVGGPGEATARVFGGPYIDSTRESTYGDVVEVFRDATDADDTTKRADRGAKELAENAPKSGLSVRLSETASFRYDPAGVKGPKVGDLVTLNVGPGVAITDTLRECTLSWSVDDGLKVTPAVGDVTADDPTRAVARLIAALSRRVRNLGGR